MAANNEVIISPDSRLQRTKVYQREDGTTFWGIWEKISFPPRDDDSYYVMQDPDKGMRMDQIAQEVYRNVNLWWVILEANNIINPFEELTSQRTTAQSNLVYSANNLVCFQAFAKTPGRRFNSTDLEGITFVTHPTALEVYVKGVLKESFTNLSPYPNLTTGEENPQFWGNIGSSYINITWLSPYTIQPEIGGVVPAPQPPEGRTYNMYGGKDNERVTLRIPSLAHIHERLST